jgi:hypothetical protein
MRLTSAGGEAIALACLVPLFLSAAVWNGFPIIYYDTGAYVFEGLGGHFLVERSPVYSLFLRFAGAGMSLWIIAVIQSAAVAFVVVESARAFVPSLPLHRLLIVSVMLTVATGLPWYVGQIEPDCFTGVVALGITVMALRADALGSLRIALLVFVTAFAAAVHPSHLLLAGFLLAAILVAKFVRRLAERPREWSRPQIGGPALASALGLTLILSANYHFTRQFFVSRAGPSFVFARMLQDGIVMRLLDDTCPGSGYRLCAYRDSLPATADGWLWTPHSPFFKLGHFEGTEAESGRIVRDALPRYPVLQLESAARDAVLQFVRFGTGDQIEPQEWVLSPVLAYFIPGQMSAYLAARQQRGLIHFRQLSALHVAVGFAALAALVVLVGWCIRRKRYGPALFLSFVLTALVGNAFICGVLSGPHDRYQSRLVWIAPFSVMLVASGGFARNPESA